MQNHDTAQSPLPVGGLSRAKDLLPLLPFKRATLWVKTREGTFPKPIKISDNITAWRNDDVNEWLRNPMAHVNNEVNHDLN